MKTIQPKESYWEISLFEYQGIVEEQQITNYEYIQFKNWQYIQIKAEFAFANLFYINGFSTKICKYNNQYCILFMPTPFPWYLLVWISKAFLVFAFFPQTLHVWLQSRWISQCRLIRVELGIVLAQLRHRHLPSAILSIIEFNTSSRSALELFRCHATADFRPRSTIATQDEGRKDSIQYCHKLFGQPKAHNIFPALSIFCTVQLYEPKYMKQTSLS